MPGIVTRRFRHHNADQFFEAFSEAEATRMYLFIGRVTPWSDETNPPSPTDSVTNTRFEIWRSMLGAKKVPVGDVTFATERNDWTTGTVYAEYDDTDTTLYANNFFVMTEDYNVYKCLYNAKGGASTIKPSGQSTGITTTDDGYKWKFMYNISTADALKFITTNYIPVATLTANDGSVQWNVQQAAANGSIDVIDVTTNGTGYVGDIGQAQAGSSTTITLASGASGSDSIYNSSSIYLTGGTGSGQLRLIQSYNGTTKVATVTSAFSTTPDNTTTYVVGPTITVSGDGSTVATAYANVTSGAVNQISLINTGLNYSEANVAISANSSHGTGAVAVPRISPPGGHGSDAVGELGGHNVMLNVQLSGAESNTLPTTNDFRVLGLLKNPLTSAGANATSTNYDTTTRLVLSSVSGTWTSDELITGGSSGAKARVVKYANSVASGYGATTGVLHLIDIEGTFTTSETITGNSSSTSATVGTITYGDLKKYSGDVIYIENRPAISRSSDQIEDIKLVVKF
jgi:hypothetical protein